MTLNLNHLYYFHVIASEGSIKAACQKLNLSQPALSSQLRIFEGWLGYDLFERKHRKLELNIAGKFLLGYSNKIFSLVDELQLSLRKGKFEEVNIFELGVLPTVASRVIDDFLRPLWSEGIFIRFHKGDLFELQEALRLKKINAILSDEKPRKMAEGWSLDYLTNRDLIVVGEKRFRSLARNFPESLDQVPFLTFTEDSPLRFQLDQYFLEHDLSPSIIGEGNDFGLLQRLVEDGIAVSVLSRQAASDALRDGKIIEIGALENIKSELWLISRKPQPTILAKSIKKFRQKFEDSSRRRE